MVNRLTWRQLPLLVCLLLLPALADPSLIQAERSLSFYHVHTHESLQVTYFADGGYLPSALARLRGYLADWRNGQEIDIDPRLLDILWEIQQTSGHEGTYEIISAYRSPQTNVKLWAKTSGVAIDSLHMQGSAIDVRLYGLETTRLRDIAIELKRGGVGYYAESNFVHVDTGLVRNW